MANDKKNYIKQFGAILRELRKSKGLTLYQAEEKLGIDWKWLQKVETGKKNIYLSSLLDLSKAYGIQPSKLLQHLKISFD